MNRAPVLCVAAHPDDEVLGVGGTLAAHAQAGARVVVLILSEGEAEKLPGTPKSDDRRGCAEAAAAALGVSEVVYADLPDQRFDAVPFIEVIKPIEAVVQRVRPEIVYTHHRGDANTDHQIAFKATYAACRPISSVGRSVRRLLSYEAPSTTEQAPGFPEYVFVPNVFVDITATWDAKVQALDAYASELIAWPHPRSLRYIEALATVRGGQGGLRIAEAFTLVRESIDPAN